MFVLTTLSRLIYRSLVKHTLNLTRNDPKVKHDDTITELKGKSSGTGLQSEEWTSQQQHHHICDCVTHLNVT